MSEVSTICSKTKTWQYDTDLKNKVLFRIIIFLLQYVVIFYIIACRRGVQMKKDYSYLLPKIKEIQDQLPDLCKNYLEASFSEKSTLTRFNYINDLKYFFDYAIESFPYFKTNNVKDIQIEELACITPVDIDRYLTYMVGKNCVARTRARRKSSVSSLFRYLVYTEQVLEKNPVQGSTIVRIEKSNSVKYLNREEQEKLLNTIVYGTGLPDNALKVHKRYYKRDLAIFFLILDTGLRVSEVQMLDVRDVDLEKHELSTIRKGKKTNDSTVFFSNEAGEYIKDYLAERQAVFKIVDSKSPLFLSNRGTRITVRNIEAMLDKYVTAAFGAGTNISPHKLRASFAMEFYRAQDRDILLLQQRMGHKNIESTNVYAKAFEYEEIRETRNWRQS